MGAVEREKLKEALRGSVHADVQSLFDPEGAFDRHIDVAVRALESLAPRTRTGSIAVEAGVSEYDAPEGARRITSVTWGRAHRGLPQWDPAYPGRIPGARLIHGEDMGRRVLLDFPPSQRQITLLGSEYTFAYAPEYSLQTSESAGTVPSDLFNILLLRAQAETMRELAMRSAGKPTQLRDGLTGSPRNQTPSALYQMLLEEVERAAPCA